MLTIKPMPDYLRDDREIAPQRWLDVLNNSEHEESFLYCGEVISLPPGGMTRLFPASLQ